MAIQKAIALIAGFESYSPTAYPDPGTGGYPWTIGYGFTTWDGKRVEPGDRITRTEADLVLEQKVRAIARHLAEEIPTWKTLNDNQQTALISFSFNVGVNWYGAPGFGSMSRMIGDRSFHDAYRVFGLYVKAHGRTLPGLVERRKAEAKLFLEGTMKEKSAIARQDTWLKQDVTAAALLADEHKVLIKKGQKITYTSWKPWASNHVQIKLTASVQDKTTWLAFDPHFDFPSEDREIWLNVPYYSQRDNKHPEWFRQCNSSSHAAILNFLKPGSVSGDDEYIQRFVIPVGNTTDWNIHTQALRRFGIESEYRQDLGIDDLERSLKAGYPVAIGVYHKGSLDAPSGGHVLVICGMKPGAFLAQDPWGKPFAYSDRNGRKVEIPISPSLERRWLTDGDNAGWGRIIKSVDGKPTGL